MNTNHTLDSLSKVFRQSFDAASKEAFEPVCGVRRSRDEALEFAYREAIKAVLNAIGYQFPVDPEREAYEKWFSSHPSPEPYDAWKAGREELRKQSGQATKEAPPWIEWKGGPCPIPDTVKRWEYRCRDGFTCRTPGSPSRYSLAGWEHRGCHENHFVAYRVLDWGSTPETFEAHGRTWFKHAPGDPMPCDESKQVFVVTKAAWVNSGKNSRKACEWNWTLDESSPSQIIGWRYAE